MRWLAILGVLAYRALVRPFIRRQCLYPESCSAHAIRVLRADGYRRAVPQIQARVQSCRMLDGACFVLDGEGRATLLGTTVSGAPPPLLVQRLARHAEDVVAARGA